ncbi:MAG TPA: hypothetical protein DCZ94_00845 [Lentisphaeria bacterium]|nr:MAG: hypothetical protein A2X48_11925 [Lentisphaerae bacterium GWF2_49_21]HBC85477.1 hypothetical protein [Lentisphaeria bacterium]
MSKVRLFLDTRYLNSIKECGTGVPPVKINEEIITGETPVPHSMELELDLYLFVVNAILRVPMLKKTQPKMA